MALQQLRFSQAGLHHGLSPSPEVMVQEEVNGRIDAAVEEGQAAGDEEPVSLPHITA